MNIDTDITGRIGVAAIQLVFTKIGWIFRERPNLDYGIDADVEQVINQEPTNRQIALQIKSGEAYCKVNEKGKIKFYIDAWHYKYWLNSDRPVIILFYDPFTERVYWDQVKTSNISKTRTRNKIEIDTNHILSNDSIEELNEVIETYTRVNLLEPYDEEMMSLDFSIMRLNDLNSSIQQLVDELQSFKDKIETQYNKPNDRIIISSFNELRKTIAFHIERDYSAIHESYWYLFELAKTLDIIAKELYLKTISKNIACIQLNIDIWKQNREFFRRLYYDNIPQRIKSIVSICNRTIEEYESILSLSISELQECYNFMMNRKI